MHTYLGHALCTIVAVGSMMSGSAQCPCSERATFAQQVDSIFSAVYPHEDEPGAAVFIRMGDDVLFKKCYGLADLETREPITPLTNFCIASVSKQFSAVAVLQLAERGLLSLDDPVSKYFPEFQAAFFHDITLRHLLTHTSGIPDARDRSNRDFVLHATDVASASYMRTLDHLNFTPGTQYEYINPTFQLLYQLIERVTGTAFEDYMHDYIFTPAEMTRATYFEEGRYIPFMAHGYTPAENGKGYTEFDYGEENFFATKADGGLYCSITDFDRWEQALRDLAVWRNSSRTDAYRSHITIQPDAEYGYHPYAGYGYGFFVQNRPGKEPIVYHTGDNGGFTIYAGKIPARDIVFLFFSTRNDIERMPIVDSVLDLMDQRGWLNAPAK